MITDKFLALMKDEQALSALSRKALFKGLQTREDRTHFYYTPLMRLADSYEPQPGEFLKIIKMIGNKLSLNQFCSVLGCGDYYAVSAVTKAARSISFGEFLEVLEFLDSKFKDSPAPGEDAEWDEKVKSDEDTYLRGILLGTMYMGSLEPTKEANLTNVDRNSRGILACLSLNQHLERTPGALTKIVKFIEEHLTPASFRFMLNAWIYYEANNPGKHTFLPSLKFHHVDRNEIREHYSSYVDVPSSPQQAPFFSQSGEGGTSKAAGNEALLVHGS